MVDARKSADREALAGRLSAAWERLAALDLPPELRARLQRQFIAVCDAVKAPGANSAACQRRLDSFLARLESALAKKSVYKN